MKQTKLVEITDIEQQRSSEEPEGLSRRRPGRLSDGNGVWNRG